tara:strand:- start:68 stop:334 length:267 start_codon:yes stop_codon:yes gene_type:complete
MKNPFSNIKWEKGYQSENSHPVHKHCDNPEKWEIKDSRFIMFCYGNDFQNNGAIDIRIMENNTDLQHQINITVDKKGKLKARITEQTK